MRSAFNKGREAACARFGIKVAKPTVPGVGVPAWQQNFLFARHGDMGHAPAAPAAPAPHTPEPVPAAPMSAAPMGAKPPPTSWESFNQGAKQHVAQGASGIGNLHTAQSAPAATSMRPQAAGAGGAASRFKMPSLGWKGTLGLMGVGALGAGAYAMHKNNQRDLNRERLVYAPMQGGFS